jgi:Hydroxyneurosporene synthase (CrtC).
MQDAAAKASIDLLSITSSVEGSVWCASEEKAAYEWWYFDALSAGGKDAVIIKFADNSIDSPRYGVTTRVPAVSFTYVRGGRTVYSVVNESTASELKCDGKALRIAESFFSFESVEYGSGFRIEIKGKTASGKRVEARFEWLLIESNIFDAGSVADERHSWNIVSPRADVTGQITVFPRKSNKGETFQFRGSGYHDSNRDARSFTETTRRWVRGRVHYADSTAIFCSYSEFSSSVSDTRLVIVRDGRTREKKVEFDVQEIKRGRFGSSYPARIRLAAEDNIRLRIKPEKIIDSSRFCQRFLAEMTLTLRDGIPRKSSGLVEFVSPKISRSRLLNWLLGRKTNT